MSDTDLILQALKDHREETRQDMHELRTATVKIADAAAEMGKTMARSEERHAQHEDGMKRLGRAVDDHEMRIRTIEGNQPIASECRRHADDIETIKTQLLTSKGSVTGGWKVLTVIAALILGTATIAAAIVQVNQ